MTDKARTKRFTVGIFSDKQTPWVVVAVLVKQLTGTSRHTVAVCNLTVPHSGRQVTIVVRTRIRGVVEVNRRVRIHRVVVTYRCFNSLIFINLIVVCRNKGRVIGLYNSAVTNLTVLVAPIGVVVDRSCQVIYLLRYCCILTTLCRCAESNQFQTCVIPYTFCRQEITQRVILDTFTNDTFHINIRRETVCKLCGYRPAVIHNTAGVGSVHTSFVVTVRAGYTYFPSLCITACTHQIIGRLTDTTKGEVCGLNRVQHFFVAAGIVQTTHGRVVELTAFLRTEVQTLNVVVLYVRLIATVAVTGSGPSERSIRVEYIRRC